MPPSRSSSEPEQSQSRTCIYKRYPKPDQLTILSKLYPTQDRSRIISQLYPKQHRPTSDSCPTQTPQHGIAPPPVQELPPEICREIGKRLESRLDAVRFRSVCRTWRSSLPRPSLFPLRVPRPPASSRYILHPKDEEREKSASFFVTETAYYAAADHQRIVQFEDACRGAKFRASALVYRKDFFVDTKLKIRPVASPSSSSSSGLTFLSNGYRLHRVFRRHKESDICARKIVIISHSNCNRDYVNPNFVSRCDLTVVALLLDQRLAVLGLRGGALTNNSRWETGFCSKSDFIDIVNYRDQLHAIDTRGRSFVMDFNPLRMIPVATVLPNHRGGRLYLIVSSKALYALHPGYFKLVMFKLLGQEWVPVLDQELDGVFFVQLCHCNFSVRRDLFEGDDYYHAQRVLQRPAFGSVPIAVGCKNAHICARRKCAMVHRPYGLNMYQCRCSCREVEVDGHLWINKY